MTLDLQPIRARLAAAPVDRDDWTRADHKAWSDLTDHAPADLAALCDEVERLRARNSQWEKSLSIHGDEFDIADLRAEVERLQALSAANWDESEAAKMLHEARQHAEKMEARAKFAEAATAKVRELAEEWIGYCEPSGETLLALLDGEVSE